MATAYRDQGYEDQLWTALQSAAPFDSLVLLVSEWKSSGLSREEGTRRISAFLEEVEAKGEPNQEEPVRKVLDLVAGVPPRHAMR